MCARARARARGGLHLKLQREVCGEPGMCFYLVQADAQPGIHDEDAANEVLALRTQRDALWDYVVCRHDFLRREIDQSADHQCLSARHCTLKHAIWRLRTPIPTGVTCDIGPSHRNPVLCVGIPHQSSEANCFQAAFPAPLRLMTCLKVR